MPWEVCKDEQWGRQAPFHLTRSSHVQLKYSETREKAKKENKPKQRNLNLSLVELIKTYHNVFENSVKKKGLQYNYLS